MPFFVKFILSLHFRTIFRYFNGTVNAGTPSQFWHEMPLSITAVNVTHSPWLLKITQNAEDLRV